MRNDKNQQQQADTQGDYTFSQSSYSGDAYANFLLGFVSTYAQLNEQSIFHWLNNTFSFYAQDNWHAKPRLTLNLGIRWDGLPHVYEKRQPDIKLRSDRLSAPRTHNRRSHHRQSESRRSGL